MTQLTRRAFIGSAVVAAGSVGAWSLLARAASPRRALVNHLALLSGGAKFCLIEGLQPARVRLVEPSTGLAVHAGTAQPLPGDLGDYAFFDFSGLTRAGAFDLHVDDARAGAVTVDDRAYAGAVNACVGYFARQRCGESRTGYNAPCHLDDGRRADNGKPHDVAGGWHDASDVRKWVSATLYGMIGLSRVLEVAPDVVDRDQLLDELRWGNRYFLRMQDRAGYLMDHCGGDQGNQFTDNKEGTADDRVIDVDPCEVPAQFQFVAANAALARHTRETDAPYSRECERAAARCLAWCDAFRRPQTATSLAAGATACVEMYRSAGAREAGVADRAAAYARQLIALQVTRPPDGAAAAGGDDPLRGFFRARPASRDSAREIMHGNLPLLALCSLIEHLPDHPDRTAWRDALRLHADYLIAMSSRSAFGTIPFGLYAAADDDNPGGRRRLRGQSYRWFMKPRGDDGRDDEWWVGINAHLASHGIGLARAARLLEDPRLAALAQRQLDWILGVNPFNVSTVTGLGRNQPPLFVTSEFKPPTPPIDGGVMNGIGGNDNDEPRLEPGSYHTCEYWTPMVAYTMWLLAELRTSHRTAR